MMVINVMFLCNMTDKYPSTVSSFSRATTPFFMHRLVCRQSQAKNQMFLSHIFTSTPTQSEIPNVQHRQQQSAMMTYFSQRHHEQMQQVVRHDSIVSWTLTQDHFFQELNISAVLDPAGIPLQKLHGRSLDDKLAAWKQSTFGYIWEPNLCFAARNFLATGRKRPHVLFTYLNENRGAFSRDVPNKTCEWDTSATHWSWWGCTDEEVWTYLDHPNTKAVFTTQHQSYSHGKVHSLPLGISGLIKEIVNEYLQRPLLQNRRTQLLMINDNGWRHRKNVTQSVLDNFANSPLASTIGIPNNTYSTGNGFRRSYLDELRKSKYILAPSGLGWDCYRIWEAIAMGTIPIIEKYDRVIDAWRETLDTLPVLWVNHFHEVTPELLLEEYPKMMAQADDYKYEKMGFGWWISYIRSFDPNNHGMSSKERISLRGVL